MPLLNAGRFPLVPLLKYGSFEQLLDKLTGALLALPQEQEQNDECASSIDSDAYHRYCQLIRRSGDNC